MDIENSKADEIIRRLLDLLQIYLVEFVAQRVTLKVVCESLSVDQKIDWALLVDFNKRRIEQTSSETFHLIRERLLTELSEGSSRPLSEWEKIVRKLVESVGDVGYPE